MKRIATAWRWLRTWVVRHRIELGLCCRVTTSAVLTYACAHMLGLGIPLWAVLTAVILTQLSLGGSVRATIDYFSGTVGAAVYAGAVGLLVSPNHGLSLVVGLVLAVAPAALVAALNPRFSAAPFTAVLVFLAPTITHATPVASAFERLLEVAVGGTVGLIVSLLVFPARARDLAIEAAARMLDLIARLQPALLASFIRHSDTAQLQRLQDQVNGAFAALAAVAVEAEHERVTRLTAEPDQGPLVRTMSRLRDDLVMLGRAGGEPLPGVIHVRLGPSLDLVGSATARWLHACARALTARQAAPAMDEISAALDGYAAAMAALRREGATRDLPLTVVEQLFALSFALDHLRRHLTDLARCASELSSPRAARVADTSRTDPVSSGKQRGP